MEQLDYTPEPPIWTPAPNPWREARRAAAGMIVAAVAMWGIWTLVQLIPPISFDALKLPITAHAEPTTAPVVIVKPPTPVQPVAAKPPEKRGPVVRDVTE